MGLSNYISNKIANSTVVKKAALNLFSRMGGYYNGSQPMIYNQPFNGEKNAGELGTVKNYIPDFQTLSARSWQAYTDSEIAQLVIHNYLLWTIGTGLKFKSEPAKDILEQRGLNIGVTDFIKLTESRFNIYLDSKRSTTARNKSFHQLAYEIKKHAIIGGDALVVLDYGRESDKNKSISARLIDGFYVQTPLTTEIIDKNFINNGVEINKYGEIVAYHVILDDMSYRRIEAYTKTGTLQAFLAYGLNYRVDDYRGIPLISVVLESITKLDRYKEATVGAAEEIAKIAMSVEHSNFGTGEDPFQKIKELAGQGIDPNLKGITNELLAQTAANVRYTTGKSVVNMPIGATLKSFENKNNLYFKEFYETNFEILCATLGIPPEVALNKYTSSFSSSRGANKNWEHKILFEREKIDLEIYQPFFNYWLEVEVYKQEIKPEGYLVAKAKDDFMVVEAWQKCRFIGSKMPFIDPVKEIQAARLKLGDQITPLSTYEQATEDLNAGDFSTNIEQASFEKALAESLGFKVEPK